MARMSYGAANSRRTGNHFGTLVGDDDWRASARCRGAGVEMVPGPEAGHVNDGEEVQAAKTICKMCPVKNECLTEALTMPHKPAGVWGGTTLEERERLRISGHNRGGMAPLRRAVEQCSRCGLDCVPRMRNILLCDTCEKVGGRAKGDPKDHEDEIRKLIGDGLTYQEIGSQLNLKPLDVGRACAEWGCLSETAKKRKAMAAATSMREQRWDLNQAA